MNVLQPHAVTFEDNHSFHNALVSIMTRLLFFGATGGILHRSSVIQESTSTICEIVFNKVLVPSQTYLRFLCQQRISHLSVEFVGRMLDLPIPLFDVGVFYPPAFTILLSTSIFHFFTRNLFEFEDERWIDYWVKKLQRFSLQWKDENEVRPRWHALMGALRTEGLTDASSLEPKTIDRASSLFLSMMAFIKDGGIFDNDTTTRATTLLRHISPSFGNIFKAEQILLDNTDTGDREIRHLLPPPRTPSVAAEFDMAEDEVHKLLLDKVTSPMQPFIVSVCRNRYRIRDAYKSYHLSQLIGSLFKTRRSSPRLFGRSFPAHQLVFCELCLSGGWRMEQAKTKSEEMLVRDLREEDDPVTADSVAQAFLSLVSIVRDGFIFDEELSESSPFIVAKPGQQILVTLREGGVSDESELLSDGAEVTNAGTTVLVAPDISASSDTIGCGTTVMPCKTIAFGLTQFQTTTNAVDFLGQSRNATIGGDGYPDGLESMLTLKSTSTFSSLTLLRTHRWSFATLSEGTNVMNGGHLTIAECALASCTGSQSITLLNISGGSLSITDQATTSQFRHSAAFAGTIPSYDQLTPALANDFMARDEYFNCKPYTLPQVLYPYKQGPMHLHKHVGVDNKYCGQKNTPCKAFTCAMGIELPELRFTMWGVLTVKPGTALEGRRFKMSIGGFTSINGFVVQGQLRLTTVHFELLDKTHRGSERGGRDGDDQERDEHSKQQNGADTAAQRVAWVGVTERCYSGRVSGEKMMTDEGILVFVQSGVLGIENTTFQHIEKEAGGDGGVLVAWGTIARSRRTADAERVVLGRDDEETERVGCAVWIKCANDSECKVVRWDTETDARRPKQTRWCWWGRRAQAAPCSSRLVRHRIE
ncbi:hypothetical protein BLNAU_24065 [Blattamonas nauphoetae]|uniref:Uncharacterized protein n=1 Tax=Blattamonas nauphoetae TaxID=2049346 RepID=A0ABQ9WRF0_9EUKA|nr:hypothetical protein BLNAU_24065 [Blattamonas nauphoetae]